MLHATLPPLPTLEEAPPRQGEFREFLAPARHGTGVWPAQLLRAAVATRRISAESEIEADQFQPASLDLRLGAEAHELTASFLPGSRNRVTDRLALHGRRPLSLAHGAVLRRGRVYLVRLQETARLTARMSGCANPKSSTGRLDIFARLITDYATEFDRIPPRYHGPLWLELAPRSFDIQVRAGTRLAQLRLRRGNPPPNDKSIREMNENLRLVRPERGSVSIKNATTGLSVNAVGDGVTGIVGFKARRGVREAIDYDLRNHYPPADFWSPIHADRVAEQGGIILQRDDFHILASKEKIIIPPDYAADMVAYDTLVGEFRPHYAGFFDPGFGYVGDRDEGAKIVLEMRSHNVPFLIEDGQLVGRVQWERLVEATDRPYGVGASYQSQGLALSRHFRR